VRSGGFGGFCFEVVAGRGSEGCSGLQPVGYGLMMAGIGGCYMQALRGLMRGGLVGASSRAYMALGLMLGALMVAIIWNG